MLRILSQDNKEEAAQIVADRLLRYAEGPLDKPETWESVSTHYPIRAVTYFSPGSGRGEFASIEGNASNMVGVIAVNVAYSDREVSAAWVHELAHCDLHVWVPPQLRGGADYHQYEGDAADIRHQIAQRVEEIILGDL